MEVFDLFAPSSCDVEELGGSYRIRHRVDRLLASSIRVWPLCCTAIWSTVVAWVKPDQTGSSSE